MLDILNILISVSNYHKPLKAECNVPLLQIEPVYFRLRVDRWYCSLLF